MKLCFLAPANSVHSYRWINYFADEGHEVHWITVHSPNINISEKIHLYQLNNNYFQPFSYASLILQIKRLLRKIKPDIFHIHSLALYGLGAFSKFRPIIETAWGSDVLDASKRIFRKKYIQYVFSRADCITCDADHLRNFMESLGADRSKIILNYYGTDTDIFCSMQRDNNLRAELGIYDDPAVISLRNLLPVYSVETLIESVPAVLEKIPNAKFLIVGKGSQEGFLKNFAKTLDVSDSVLFLGEIDNNRLPRYLTSMDIYVSTSLSDGGLAASTKEAMACELPVIITDSGENGKWVIDGVNGFLIPVRDPKQLSEKIIYLLKDEHLRRKIGKNGRKVIQESHNYHVEMKKMEYIYEGMASL